MVLEVGKAQLSLLRSAKSVVDLGLALRLLTPNAVNLICVSLQLKLNFLKSLVLLSRIHLLRFNLQKSLFQLVLLAVQLREFKLLMFTLGSHFLPHTLEFFQHSV